MFDRQLHNLLLALVCKKALKSEHHRLIEHGVPYPDPEIKKRQQPEGPVIHIYIYIYI